VSDQWWCTGLRAGSAEREIPSASLRAGSSLRLKSGYAQDDKQFWMPESAARDGKRPARVVISGREYDAPGSYVFRKHHRPCGQPAVEGGIERFRPLPAQAGHFMRINATPSDLPLTSTGLATYPVPPQRGQSFGFTPPPHCHRVFHQFAQPLQES
jgi:hypothetical protein